MVNVEFLEYLILEKQKCISDRDAFMLVSKDRKLSEVEFKLLFEANAKIQLLIEVITKYSRLG